MKRLMSPLTDLATVIKLRTDLIKRLSTIKSEIVPTFRRALQMFSYQMINASNIERLLQRITDTSERFTHLSNSAIHCLNAITKICPQMISESQSLLVDALTLPEEASDQPLQTRHISILKAFSKCLRLRDLKQATLDLEDDSIK